MCSKYRGFLKILLTLPAWSLLLMKQCHTNPLFMIIYWSMMYIWNHLQEVLVTQNWDHVLWMLCQFFLKWVGKSYTLMSNPLWVMHAIVCHFCSDHGLITSTRKSFIIKTVFVVRSFGWLSGYTSKCSREVKLEVYCVECQQFFSPLSGIPTYSGSILKSFPITCLQSFA